jgi:hypothetical protein
MTEVRKSYLDKLVDFFKKNTGFATLFYIVKAEVTKILAKHGILKEDIVEDVTQGVLDSLDFQEFIKNYNTSQGKKIRVFRLGTFIKAFVTKPIFSADPLGYAEQLRTYFEAITFGKWQMRDNFFPEEVLLQLEYMTDYRSKGIMPCSEDRNLDIVVDLLRAAVKEIRMNDNTYTEYEFYHNGSWQELSTRVHPSDLFYNIRSLSHCMNWYKNTCLAHGESAESAVKHVDGLLDYFEQKYDIAPMYIRQDDFKDACKEYAMLSKSKVTDLDGDISRPQERTFMPVIDEWVFEEYVAAISESERECRVTDYAAVLKGVNDHFEEILKEEASENISGHDGE